MSKEIKIGCGAPSTVSKTIEDEKVNEESNIKKEETNMIRVGKPAPLFKAEAFQDGKFTEVALEDYKGKWVLLCFYPGDFTFV